MSTLATPTSAISPATSSSRLPQCARWRRQGAPPLRGPPLCFPHLPLTSDAPPPVASVSARVSRRMEMDDEEDCYGECCPSDLEDELFDFMVNSSNPRSFPSKADLVAAGRTDLVQAIENRGGWLSLGWDSGPVQMRRGDSDGDGRASSSSDASSSGRSIEETGERGHSEGGIEGILGRLEKERSLSFGFAPTRKSRNSKPREGDDPRGLARTGEKSQRFILLDPEEDLHDHGEENAYGGNKFMGRNFQRNISENNEMKSVEKRSSWKDLGKGSDMESKNMIQLRLQRLESKLTSTLNNLRSKNTLIVPESKGVSSKQLPELSDALEFQETEVIKARDKLRELRTKLSVLDGKMGLDISDAQAMLAKKQKRLDAAQKALGMLRHVCIVWPNTASEVLLCGSFDGWTRQRKMERSSTGVFSLCIRLYPDQVHCGWFLESGSTSSHCTQQWP